jgi:CDP-glucose 4,6-dehydratase
MDFLRGGHLKDLSGPILITGHTGFKGTWLTLLLEELGVACVGLSLREQKGSLFERLNREGSIPEVFGDIKDYSVIERTFNTFKPSAVIHLAAQPLVIESYKNPIETFGTNVMGTANVLDISVRESNVKAVIAVTTDKVYKNDELGRKFVESDPLYGKDPYSASKVGSEAAISAWRQISLSNSGPEIVSVRAGNVIGGGDWSENRLMPDLIKSLTLDQSLVIRSPRSTRPWQHALDPIKGYLLALEAALAQTSDISYNFGPLEDSLSVSEVCEIAIKAWGKSNKIKIFDSAVANLSESGSLDLDSGLAVQNLNWRPVWAQKDAVIATIDWWKSINNGSKSAREACQVDIDKVLSDA